MKQHIILTIQLLMSLVLLWLLFNNLDWSKLSTNATHVPIWFLLLSFFLLLIGQLFYILKWTLVIRLLKGTTPFSILARLHFIGLLFNNFLPTSFGGDTAKVFYLGKDIGYQRTFLTVLLDRFFGLFALTVISFVFIHIVPKEPVIQYAKNVLYLALAGMGFSLLGVFILSITPIRERIRKRIPNTFETARKRISAIVDVFQAILNRPLLLIYMFLCMLAYYLLLTVIYIVFFFVILNGDLPSPAPIFACLTCIALFNNIPITFNGVGLNQHLHIILFASLGIKEEIAVIISFIIYLQSLLMSAIGYVFWINSDVVKSNCPKSPSP